MTFQELFARIYEVMAERTKPENLLTTIIQLIIVLAIGSIPFIGVPLALLAFIAIVSTYFNDSYGNY